MIYTLPLPVNYNPDIDDAGSVHRWLDQNGCTPEYVSVTNIDDTLMLEIESDIDPTSILQSFPVTETPETPTDMAALMSEMETMQVKLDALLAALGV